MPRLVVRKSDEVRRHRAPADQSGEQAVDRCLQHWRMVAELRRFPERLVDDRVERDNPSYELAPNWLSIREIGSGQRQCVGKPARDLSGNGAEDCGEPTPAKRLKYGTRCCSSLVISEFSMSKSRPFAVCGATAPLWPT